MIRLFSWAFLVAAAMIWATTVVRGDTLADIIHFAPETHEYQTIPDE